MSKIFFITSTGTEIGKTYYLEKLCREFKDNNERFFAIKPIISGFSFEDKNNDNARILSSLGLEYNKKNLDEISPWRFKEAISPNMAAQKEGQKINSGQVVNFCKKHITISKTKKQNLLIEGAGGVMTPINDQFTYLDLIKELDISVILVTGNYLGTISHTLSAIKCLENENIKIGKVILNTMDKKNCHKANLENLKNFAAKYMIEII